MEPELPPTWRAGYSFPLSDGKVARVELDEIRSSECPKSIMLRNPSSAALVAIAQQMDEVRGAMGAPSRWPSAFVDAVRVLRAEKRRDRNAQTAAVRNA
jgi:hypothetical protein